MNGYEMWTYAVFVEFVQLLRRLRGRQPELPQDPPETWGVRGVSRLPSTWLELPPPPAGFDLPDGHAPVELPRRETCARL